MRAARKLLLIGGSSFVTGLVAVTLATSIRATPGGAQAEQRERTVLAERVETARQIRAALAKPLAAIEPLPPISTKVARAPAPVPAEALDAYAQKPRPPRKVPIEVRDALARAEWNGLVRSAQSERSGRSWQY